MKIALVSDQYWPSTSGVSVSIDSFTRELVKMGHKVFLFATDYPDSERVDSQWAGTSIFRFRSKRIPFDDDNRLVYYSEKQNIYKALKLADPDIIHLQTELTLGKFAIRYAKKNKIPLIITAHSNWEVMMTNYTPCTNQGIARWYCMHFMRKRYNKADMVVVPSSCMEVLLSLYFVKTPIRIIPSGIIKSDFEDNDRFTHKSAIYDAYPQLINKKILLYVGRLGREKNIPFLMDVLQNLLVYNKNIVLIVAGNGPAYGELVRDSRKRGIAGNVIFTGFIERKMLKYFYTIADVFVFASKVESQGLVIIESMISGTPVVAVGKMGIREVMGGDNGGFMVEDNLQSFTEKTELLLNNPEIHRIKAKEATEYAKNWTNEKFAERLVDLYRSILSEKLNFSHIVSSPVISAPSEEQPGNDSFREKRSIV